MTYPDLDHLVELARRDRPPQGVLATLARNLRVPFVAVPVAALTVPTTAAAGVAAKTGITRLALLGWGTGTTVAASGVVLAVALGQAPTSPPVAPPPVAPVAPHRAEPAAVKTPIVTEVPEVPTAPAPSLRAVKEAPASWDEPQLIERARRALTTDPRRAFTLSQEHQRRFPGGALGVERDLIAVEALARMGQSGEAKRRALAFEAKYPRSIHLPRVQALLARLDGH